MPSKYILWGTNFKNFDKRMHHRSDHSMKVDTHLHLVLRLRTHGYLILGSVLIIFSCSVVKKQTLLSKWWHTVMHERRSYEEAVVWLRYLSPLTNYFSQSQAAGWPSSPFRTSFSQVDSSMFVTQTKRTELYFWMHAIFCVVRCNFFYRNTRRL
jgi:hypothetical protein